MTLGRSTSERGCGKVQFMDIADKVDLLVNNFAFSLYLLKLSMHSHTHIPLIHNYIHAMFGGSA